MSSDVEPHRVPTPRTVSVSIPTVAGLLDAARGTVIWSLDTVAFVAQLPHRIDGLMARVDELLTSVEKITADAAAAIENVEKTNRDAAEVVDGAGTTSDKALALITEFEPITAKAMPMAKVFVDNFSDEEVQAAIQMIDHLPELMDRMETIMPILATMDTVAPEIHQLLEVTKDVRKAVIGIPGFKFFRNRGEERLSGE